MSVQYGKMCLKLLRKKHSVVLSIRFECEMLKAQVAVSITQHLKSDQLCTH